MTKLEEKKRIFQTSDPKEMRKRMYSYMRKYFTAGTIKTQTISEEVLKVFDGDLSYVYSDKSK
jgi:hypothetical protein